LFVALGASLRTPAGGYLLGGMLCVYFVACVASAAPLVMKEKDPRYFIATPVILFLTHVLYGLGSAYGILKPVPPISNQLQDSQSTLPI
jgi:succinoglycan biosynthesis protein ExoA